jgi:hypothetical protein
MRLIYLASTCEHRSVSKTFLYETHPLLPE